MKNYLIFYFNFKTNNFSQFNFKILLISSTVFFLSSIHFLSLLRTTKAELAKPCHLTRLIKEQNLFSTVISIN